MGSTKESKLSDSKSEALKLLNSNYSKDVAHWTKTLSPGYLSDLR